MTLPPYMKIKHSPTRAITTPTTRTTSAPYHHQMQLCTYVIKIRSLPEIHKILKSYLCSEHEVVSARRMKFSTVEIDDTDNSSIVKHDLLQLKIKTRKPAYVASKLLGKNSWVKEHQGIVFKANPNKN
mmetsp:Transcript_13649/g.19432  ORF Transcript_13649/g.19432 Transcript_13649/m.19432 type:complete len:128 (+) Transcript_13649:112-495(+)